VDRLFARAGALGGAAAAVPFAWLVALGRLDLLQRHDLAGFYDAQAHALLDGHWDIPREELGFEAFIVDGKAYTYFGPWPTLLRMPVAACPGHCAGRPHCAKLAHGSRRKHRPGHERCGKHEHCEHEHGEHEHCEHEHREHGPCADHGCAKRKDCAGRSRLGGPGHASR